ncbi:MAG: hypothetical protein KAT04_01685 [Methylococcales bacterium]|nr:hypothetical protein [Methylococcales bacterium]
MLRNSHYCKHIISFSLLVILSNNVYADQLANFSSDGCSQFPDGTLTQTDLWCECCISHDLAYWQGGSQKQKQQADKTLRDCVLQKTNNKLFANIMYYGVTVGGLPVFPTWYRWGYGWRYGRGFQSLNLYEQQLVEIRLQHYHLSTPFLACEFDYPPRIYLQKQWKKLIAN